MQVEAICCEDVTVARNGKAVLSGLSLSIPAGQFVGLFGPNGAGKTTFLRALMGLLPLQKGRISVLGQSPGKDVNDIGYMPQNRSANGASLTGWDLLVSGISGSRWGLPRLSRADRLVIQEALDSVAASDLASRRLGELSGGERQRLLIAQALIGCPRLLLLDEPLASLDPVRMRDIAERLGTLVKQRGMTVLCSAHDINALMGVMNSVMYVARGHARLGSVDQVMTTETLSALYGAPVEVCRTPSGRLLVSTDAL